MQLIRINPVLKEKLLWGKGCARPPSSKVAFLVVPAGIVPAQKLAIARLDLMLVNLTRIAG